MPKWIYTWTRDLHLYFGLFISPFLVLFAVSVFFLNHPRPPAPGPLITTRTVRDLRVPAGIEQAQGMERVQIASLVLSEIGVAGEVNFIRAIPKEHRLVIPVLKPGIETTVDLNVERGIATISERRTALWESLSYLHRSPGPHNAAIRGNWFWTHAWRWLADASVYVTLFLSVSGLYLWTVIRSERKIGLLLMLGGALSFAGLVYAVAA